MLIGKTLTTIGRVLTRAYPAKLDAHETIVLIERNYALARDLAIAGTPASVIVNSLYQGK